MSSGAERLGQNIRDVGRLEKQEDRQENQSTNGVNNAEAAYSFAAKNAYVMGKKIAEQRTRHKLKADFEPEEKNKLAPARTENPETMQ